jgi:excisionase family DNA binding protein
MTTQAASEMLGCSRPHLISLLENGEIPFIKVGKHRRIKYEDVIKYKDQMYSKQRERITEMMKMDEDLGLYDS